MTAHDALCPTGAAVLAHARKRKLKIKPDWWPGELNRPVLQFGPVGRSPLERLYARVDDFQRRKFPKQTLDSKLAHLQREVAELRAAPTDLTEFADCLILLLGCAAVLRITPARLLQAAQDKMDVNNLRRWGAPDHEGVRHHIEPRRKEARR